MEKVRQSFLFVFISLILLGCGYSIEAQTDGKPVFVGDLDGNGKSERIVQIKYEKPTQLLSKTDVTKREARKGLFVKYVLYRDSKKKGTIIFDYLIGDEESVYWEYKIEKAADLNNDGYKDLVFHAGDDTTYEYVFLIQKPNYFKAVYSGTIGVDGDFLLEFDKSNNFVLNLLNSKPSPIVAKWNPQREIFEGLKIRWTTQDCKLYEENNDQSEVVSHLSESEVVFVTDVSQNLWQKVKTPWGEGWVERRYLSDVSPTAKFAVK